MGLCGLGAEDLTIAPTAALHCFTPTDIFLSGHTPFIQETGCIIITFRASKPYSTHSKRTYAHELVIRALSRGTG